MRSSNPNLISSLPTRVICLGEILDDCLANQSGETQRRRETQGNAHQDRGQPLDRVKSWTLYPGGAPGNTACA